MIQPLSLIVLHTQPYSETSLIVYAYTNLLGRQTFLLKGIRTQANHARVALFHPLSLLETQAYLYSKREMQALKEYHKPWPLDGLVMDIKKSAMALFMSELLYRSIRETDPDQPLFDFIVQSVLTLDQSTSGPSDFHLRFATQLCAFLGYQPVDNYAPQTPYFHIAAACFKAVPDLQANAFDLNSSLLLHHYLEASPKTGPAPWPQPQPLHSGARRHAFLQSLLAYYDHHFDKPLRLRSTEILHRLFAQNQE